MTTSMFRSDQGNVDMFAPALQFTNILWTDEVIQITMLW